MRIGAPIILVGCVLVLVPGSALAQSSGAPTVPYHLQPGSTYEQGCYGECLCPILQAPLAGTFGLELLPTAGPLDVYGVGEIDFAVPALDLLISGSGFYIPSGELNLMDLGLRLNGEPARSFNSGGQVPAGAEFPDIDIVISVNQMMSCFDYVLHIVASPDADPWPKLSVAPSTLAWTPVSGAEGYDVVCGNLDLLRDTSGDFTASTDQCLESGYAETSMTYDLTPGEGQTLWFLVRAAGGSYDAEGGSQVGGRDAEIAAAPLTCP